MKREHELRQRLRSLQALNEAIGAMKSLSARHYREVRATVEPARIYREGIERMLGWANVAMPAGGGGAGLLVVGAELGLCGGYNAQVVAAGAEHRAGLGEGPTFCAGGRAAAMLRRRGIELMRSYSGPTSVQGITETLLHLAEELLTMYVELDLASLDIASTRFGGVGVHTPRILRLLPLASPAAERPSPPLRYVGQSAMTAAVVREYLYITLYDLLIDALAAEHSARLVATEAAEQWLTERSHRVRRQLVATRREATTQEVLEIAAGARARRVRAETPGGITRSGLPRSGA